MLILHGALDGRALLLWAEASPDATSATDAKGARRKVKAAASPTEVPHPFCADRGSLSAALGTAGLTISAEAAVAGTAIVWLPSAQCRPLPSSPLLDAQ